MPLYKIGAVRQIMPLLLSVLMRSLKPIICGGAFVKAISRGGIGLMLTFAVINQKAWDAVRSQIVPIIMIVLSLSLIHI